MADAGEAVDDDPQGGGIAADRLRSLNERIDRLEEERKALGSNIKDTYSEAKSAGYRMPPPSVPSSGTLYVSASTPN